LVEILNGYYRRPESDRL